MESSFFSTGFSPLPNFPPPPPFLPLITTLQSPEKEEEGDVEGGGFFLPSPPEFECRKRETSPPFLSFPFSPSPPFSSLDRCLAKKGRRGRGKGVKQTRSSPPLPFPRKNSHQKNAFSFFFPPLFPGKWGRGRNGGKGRAKRLLLGKKRREGRHFPLKWRSMQMSSFSYPLPPPQKKSGEKGGVSTKERIYVKRALRARHQKKKRMEKDPIKSPWEKGMNIRSDKTLFRISPKPNW